MATDVEIVIRAVDRFGAVFDDLGKAFGRVGQSGTEAQASVAGLAQGVGSLAASAETARQTMAALATESAEGLVAQVENQGQALEEMAGQQEAAATSLAERLLAVDADFHARRAEQQEQALARQRETQAAFLAEREAARVREHQSAIEAERQLMAARLESNLRFFQQIAQASETHHRSTARLAKNLGIAQALLATYLATNNALAGPPFPFNLAAAALVLAQGLANVRQMRAVNLGRAHGGLDFVPQEQTFLLNRGERVLAPDQNRDLMDFLRRQTGPGGSNAAPQINITIQGGADDRAVERLMRRLEEQVALRRLRLAN